MTEPQPQPPTRSVGPRSTRWTHIALPCTDIDRTIAWYERFTPLQLLDRRTDAEGQGAWLGHPDQGENPFILVLACFNRDKDGPLKTTMAPFAHIGFEMATRQEVDDIAARGAAEGCLAWEPRDMPDPIGYISALRDPDGNLVEFSHNQGVYAKAQEVWG